MLQIFPQKWTRFIKDRKAALNRKSMIGLEASEITGIRLATATRFSKPN